MASNLYKVGDWVYCETSPFQPYVVRKIEELTKTPSGNVEAKVIFAFRKQDIPAAIMATVERYQAKNSGDKGGDKGGDESGSGATEYEESEVNDLNDQQRYQLKHREMYFSKYSETIAATTIRSKCSVLLFNEEVERYSDYVSKDDSFYYHLTYDPYQKSIVADKGEIRVGMRYQAEVPALKYTPNGSVIEQPAGADAAAAGQTPAAQYTSANDRVLRSQLQKMADKQRGGDPAKDVPEIPITAQTDDMFQWCPIASSIASYDNQLTDADIDKYLTLAKSVGTYARALDCNNACKQPSLPLSAACASRDITAFHAMNVLHDYNYDIGKALMSLITENGPIINKDQIEDWSVNEANLFEDALEKLGKDFVEIRREFLPWKTMKSIIEYYYSWKTTDRYVHQKRIKLMEQESKLKQVYIPHSKQSQSALIRQSHLPLFQQYDLHLRSSCESCGTPTSSTNQWFVYSPTQLTQLIMTGVQNPAQLTAAAAQIHAQMVANAAANGAPPPTSTAIYQSRLCGDCWTYWKKYAQFKFPNARQERLNQLKNQVHKCSVNGCGREFKMKQLLVKHCGVAHGYFAKTNVPAGGPNSPRPPPMRNRTSFYLYTTPMTKAARLVCPKTIRMFKLARKPFKLIELAELNKEWTGAGGGGKEPRDIGKLLAEHAKVPKAKPAKLTVAVIEVIKKNRRAVLNTGKNGKSLTNGHSAEDESGGELNEGLSVGNQEKPSFLRYFEQKCTTPCYSPEQILFPKPSADQINKFFLNLMSQNKKRQHEQAASGGGASEGSGSEAAPTTTKRTLLNHASNHHSSLDKSLVKAMNAGTAAASIMAAADKLKTPSSNVAPQKQGARSPTKSLKPQQSINLDVPEEIYYVPTTNLVNIRKEIKAEHLRKLGRDPFKLLNKQHQELYTTLAKIESDCKTAQKTKKVFATNGTTKPLTNGGGSAKATSNGEHHDDDGAASTLTIDDSNKDASTTNGVGKEDEHVDSTPQDVNMKSVNGDDGDEKMGSQEAKSGEAMVVLE